MRPLLDVPTQCTLVLMHLVAPIWMHKLEACLFLRAPERGGTVVDLFFPVLLKLLEPTSVRELRVA